MKNTIMAVEYNDNYNKRHLTFIKSISEFNFIQERFISAKIIPYGYENEYDNTIKTSLFQ